MLADIQKWNRGMMVIYCVGIDLGGTTIKAGIVDEDYRIVKSGAVPTVTDRGAQGLVGDMKELVSSLLEETGISMEEIASVGLGVPGTANKKTGVMEYANNLNMKDEPLIPLLKRYFKKPVSFTNDANAAAWGEYLAGCGKGYASMVMVTLGTGIGGGMILDGKLYEGCNFAAGEFGHFVIQYDGEICNCGRRGCFETYASATGLRRMALKAMKEEEGRRSLLWSLCGQDEDKVDGQKIFEAARRGDLTAESVVERYLYYLSVGITDIINIFQPEVLCIGGGVSRAKDQLLEPLKRLVDQQVYTRDSAVKTEIVIASLGNDAGIIGAAMLDD